LSKLRKKDDRNRGENKMAGEEGWTMALNLEGFEVVQAEVERKQRQVRLTVLPQWPVAVCPHCG